ncbi:MULTISPECIES: GNAT family N-acetyltransferase [Streptomyces]|uniref:GNAT family protein n=1 Tax=Streptomyces evansiae TaxID=3075535 RepID=A0ABD5ECF5_9ACTN|nr:MULTISPECIES: GNAT family protein [unclassified Streptomyces]ASY32645.1 GNAT family N-acetyltransferase [Streptomyces sp. CLI2509]MDT0418462.1 GNAT family protein [Streptomyces sp. DSM 41982]MYX21112.1 GNAT family N-acetyltransferase [Streptomyces sp. SID8380]SCE04852.1 Protein N-acetyltransferase, RimJ/RimL family [Streptomyces sp. SolWspMP-sol7th]
MFAIPLGPEGAELRPLETWHAAEFLTHVERGRDFIGTYIGFVDAVVSEDTARDLLHRYATKRAADEGHLYGIWTGCERPGGGTLVGGVLFRVFDAATGVCEIGCWLEPAGTGRGLVTRACRVLADWAFHERGMHRVEWWAAAGNTASTAVARRLGMTREAVLRESNPRGGVRHDMEGWAVLAHEWDAPKDGGPRA